ncbi:MAG: outer membrane beta-barrel protein [Rhizobiaceae bacterium]
MTLLSRLLLAAAIGTTAATTSSMAADYDPPIIVDKAPEFVPVEVGNGWYLRGDIGYSFSATSNGPVNYRIYNAGVYTPATFATADFDNDVVLGLGIGYQFNSWLRADATFENHSNDFQGTTVSANPCPGQAAGTTCRSENSSSVNFYSLMANVYGDLGTYAGFTPYVGAGAGMARARWDTLSDTSYCVGAGCPANPLMGTTTHPGAGDWRFTYALMAGIAYDVSRNLKIDVGYKYRHINGGDMFLFDGVSAGAGAIGIQGSDDGLTQHEVRVGVRYSLW